MSNRNCSQLETELQRTPDLHEVIATPSLRNHLQNCADCRDLFEELALLDMAVVRWKEATPTVDFTDAIITRLTDGTITPSILSPATDQPTNSGRGSFVALSAIAILLLAVIMSSAPESQPRPVSQPPVVMEVNSGSAETDPLEPSFPLLDAGSMFVTLADGTAAAVHGGANLVAGQNPDDPANAAIGIGESGWMRDLGRTLAPYGRDLEQAASFLFEAEPVEEPDRC
jgi:hypothetical protein